jgi:hypothetical protein
MVSEVLNTAHGVSRTVQEGVRKPVQQIAGIVAGLRAGLETLVQRSPFGHRAERAGEAATVYESTTVYETPVAEPAGSYGAKAASSKPGRPYDI